MLSAFQSLFRKRPPQAVRSLYIALVAQARKPFFYEKLSVPDSIDGRFEMIVLHLFLLEQRLHAEDPDTARFLSEAFFEDMDASIREFGVGDTGVSHRIKRMGKAYHGRLQAYATDDDELLKAALSRNLYGTVAEGDPALLAQMASYIRLAQQQLKATDTALICGGAYAWPDTASL